MSTVILDTITGKSTATTITIGSTPVVSASANSMTIRGEGSAQTSIQQGLCKQWCHYDGAGTPTIADSFNVSSITDNAAGNHTQNATNNFANANFAVTAMPRDEDTYSLIMEFDSTNVRTTSTVFTAAASRANGAAHDVDGRSVIVHGDLA